MLLITAIYGAGLLFFSTFAEKIEIRMPGVVPQEETYACTSVRVQGQSFITGFEALNEAKNAHHLLIFGCEEPGSYDQAWDCGEMTARAQNMERASPCQANPSIIYAWAKDAPKLQLPKDVGFRVGGDSGINYVVMQVHYMKDMEQEDVSGVAIEYSEEPVPKLASTMLLVTGGLLMPKTTESFETACRIEEDVVMHPFAFRTHTHSHGQEVTGWLVKEDQTGADHWSLIGRRDPQLPQMFVPVNDSSMVIKKGDIVSARCVLKNDETHVITMGPTNNDEMCNLYIMYWTEGDNGLSDNTCFSPGAPQYYWSSEAHLNHIPK